MGVHFFFRGLSCRLLLWLLIGCGDATHDDNSSSLQDIISSDADRADAVEENPSDSAATAPSVISDGDSYLCIPAGPGPFPGVLYDQEASCQALAEAGYVGYAKQRRLTIPMAGHIDGGYEGLDALLAAEKVDPEQIAIMGFSRGFFCLYRRLWNNRTDSTPSS
jgi:hypothetical protein